MSNDTAKFEIEWAANVDRINDAFVKYGWVINPHHIIGMDQEDVLSVVELIEQSPGTDRKEMFDRITDVVLQSAFNLRFRAFYLYRATQLPHLKTFAHYLERALLHYYRSDFFSAILVLLPALEGVLRSHAGVEKTAGGDARPIIAKIEKKKPEPSFFAGRYFLYRKWLMVALREWIFKQTGSAESKGDFDLSYMNRHYVLHGLGDGHFYSAADCARLFVLFDLYIETLTCETGGISYANFFPDDGQNAFVDQRMAHYFALMSNTQTLQRVEETFMREHESYNPETQQTSLLERIVADAARYQQRFDETIRRAREGLSQNREDASNE